MKASRIVIFLCLAVVGAAAWLLWPQAAPSQQASGQRPDRAVAVHVAEVRAQSIPLGFPATATIEAISSIPLRARVDGEVTAVHVADGAHVKAGQPILDIDARIADAEIAAQRAVVARDTAALVKAARDLGRAAELARLQAQSKVTVADAETARDLAKASLAENEARLTQLLASRAHYTITAPADGRIGRIAARPGTWLRSSDAYLTTLVVFDPVYASVGVPQNQIADVAAAVQAKTARIEVTVPGRDERLSGPVTVIENSADTDTGLITVRAEIANGGPLLWPGQIADAYLLLRQEENVLTIPREAVQTAQDGTYVYMSENGKAVRRNVRLARMAGSEAVIADGLKAGEQVVRDGQIKLTDGAAITVASP